VKITWRDIVQVISGLWIIVAGVFVFTLPVIYVFIAGLTAFVFAPISLVPQRSTLQKRQKILGMVELIFSGLLLLFLVGLIVRYLVRYGPVIK